MAQQLIRPNEAYLRLPRAVVQAFEEMRADADADDWVDVLRLRGVEHALREYAWSVRLPHEKPGVLFQELLMFRELVERRFLAGSECIRRELLLSHIDRMLKDAEGSVVELPPLVVEPAVDAQKLREENLRLKTSDCVESTHINGEAKALRKLIEPGYDKDTHTIDHLMVVAEGVKKLQTRVEHWRQECGKLDARAQSATEYKMRVKDLQRRVEELELTVEIRGDRIRRNIEVAERQILELQAERDGWKSDAEQRAQNAEQHKTVADAANARADRAEAKLATANLAALGERSIPRKPNAKAKKKAKKR